MIENGIVISLNICICILIFFLVKKYKSIFWFYLYVIKCLFLCVDDINSFLIVFWILLF